MLKDYFRLRLNDPGLRKITHLKSEFSIACQINHKGMGYLTPFCRGTKVAVHFTFGIVSTHE